MYITMVKEGYCKYFELLINFWCYSKNSWNSTM